MTRQQVLFVAVFLLILLFNVLAHLRQRRATRPRAGQEPEPAAPAPPAARPPVIDRPAPRSRRRRDTIIGPPAPQLGRTSRGGGARLAARDLRRAIVLSAILTPCHGVQPPGHVVSDLPSDR